jgi:hypothetical protein
MPREPRAVTRARASSPVVVGEAPDQDDVEETDDTTSWECSRCEERFSEDDGCYQSTHEGIVCNSCYDTAYFTCSHCQRVLRSDSYYDSDCYCVRCAEAFRESDEDEDESNCGIHEYNYKPRPKFFGKGKLFYGVELEVNAERHRARTVYDLLGDDRVYIKHDSSIKGEGFEIVTMPHTLTAQRELWKGFFNHRPRGMTSYEGGSCGMHVHVSRDALTRLQIHKMVVFLNNTLNKQFVVSIAQRSSNGYSALKAEKTITSRSGDRYEALNLENHKTVEFRIFRGTVRGDRFFKNLEFVDALIHWVNEVNYNDLGYKGFCDYVQKHRKAYKFLHAYLVEKGWCKPDKKPKSAQQELPALVPQVRMDEEGVVCV